MDRLIINGPYTLEADTGEIYCETEKVSDGYHTIGELYEHRFELFVALMHSNPEISFRAKFNHDGARYPGWFVAGMRLSTGQISYHLPERYWDRLSMLETYERYPNYDGHSSQDVLDRLRVWYGVKAAPVPSSAG
jgi:hypothetical protein